MAEKNFDVENLGDELIERADVVKKFYDNNKKPIIYIGGAILGVLVLYVAYTFLYLNPRNNEASNEIWKVQQAFEKDSFDLVLKGRTGKNEMKSAIEIVDEYSGTDQANLASYYAGVAYLRTGKYAEAIEYLEKFSSSDDVIAPTAKGLLADAYVEQGNLDKGAKLYEKAAAMSINDYSTPKYLKKAADIYLYQKEYKKAQSLYEKIKKDFEKSTIARDMDKYIELAKAYQQKG